MPTLAKGSQDPAVTLLQRLLNVALDRQPPLRTDGGFGDQTDTAVRDFQNWARLSVTGAVDDAQLDLLSTTALQRGWQAKPAKSDADEPLWLGIARREDGQMEQPGTSQNPRILDFVATFPYLRRIHGTTAPTLAEQDETAWCACFVNWCLLRAGQLGGPDASAASWRDYGASSAKPVPGAVTIIYSTPSSDTASGFHVAFFVRSGAGKRVTLYGGNQSNKVCLKEFGYEKIWYRWPV